MSGDRVGKWSEDRFIKISTLVVLVALLGIAGLLAYQNWRLLQEFASAPQAVALPAAPASVVPPAAEPVPSPAVNPVPPAAPSKPTTPVAATANYTQPEASFVPPEPVSPVPPAVPVGRVVPTDVIPAEPMPFPPTAPSAPTPPEILTATLPSGSVLTVRLLDTLNTDRNQAGDRFRASLEEPIVSDGTVVLPRGSIVQGRIIDSQQAGRVSGVAEMTLELSQLRLAGGETVVLESSAIRREGETSIGKDTAKVGAGAAIGAVLGAIGGGGKGAAVGAASGAGAGTAGVLLTRGEPLILSQETVLSFQLNAPVTLTYAPGQANESVYSAPAAPVLRAPRRDDWDRDRPILRRR